MTEMELRRAVLKLKLKANSKIVLVALLLRLDWSTWSGLCSASDVADELTGDKRMVNRAFKDLIDQNLISRVAQRKSERQHYRAFTRVNVSLILSLAKMKSPPDEDQTPTVMVTHPSDKVTLPPSVIVTHPSDKVTLPPSDKVTLPPSVIVTDNSTKDNQLRITTEITTKDNQQSSEPDQQSKAEEVEVLVDEGKYPQHVIDYAKDNGHTLERAQEIMDNVRRKLEIRRAREKSGANHNRPTTAYNPKPY